MNAIRREKADTPKATLLGIEPLIAVLRQLAQLLHSMDDDQFVAKPGGVVSSSVGGHVRHCLDHVDSLLAAIGKGEVNYDHRERGTEIESNRSAALQAIKRQEEELEELRFLSPDQPMVLHALLVAAGPRVTVETSLGRELAFVLSHTVHHNALIGIIAKLLGVTVPDRFGYAPSTLAHLEKNRCAQ